MKSSLLQAERLGLVPRMSYDAIATRRLDPCHLLHAIECIVSAWIRLQTKDITFRENFPEESNLYGKLSFGHSLSGFLVGDTLPEDFVCDFRLG